MFKNRFHGPLQAATRHKNTIARPSLNITVHVSFKKQSVVTVSPPSNPLQGKRFVLPEINNITATGFDVVFQSLTGASASGAADFTYQAFGK